MLADTFQLAEGGAAMLDGMEVLEGNSERAKRQKAQPIMVVIGNPPYSVGQDSQNDDNQNVKYETLDARIAATYAALSTATNKNSCTTPTSAPSAGPPTASRTRASSPSSPTAATSTATPPTGCASRWARSSTPSTATTCAATSAPQASSHAGKAERSSAPAAGTPSPS